MMTLIVQLVLEYADCNTIIIGEIRRDEGGFGSYALSS